MTRPNRAATATWPAPAGAEPIRGAESGTQLAGEYRKIKLRDITLQEKPQRIYSSGNIISAVLRCEHSIAYVYCANDVELVARLVYRVSSIIQIPCHWEPGRLLS